MIIKEFIFKVIDKNNSTMNSNTWVFVSKIDGYLNTFLKSSLP